MTLKPNPDPVTPAGRLDRRFERHRTRLGSSQEVLADHGSYLLSDAVAALSHALDISEGHEPQHGLRTAVIGMRIGNELGLASDLRQDLYYTLLLKDLGASSNASQVYHLFGTDDWRLKRALRSVDLGDINEGAWFMLSQLPASVPLTKRLRYALELGLGRFHAGHTLMRNRAERGAQFALDLGMGVPVADAIRAVGERYDGRGHPFGLSGDGVPLLARIAAVALAIELAFTAEGQEAAQRVAVQGRGERFDPDVVDAVLKLWRTDRVCYDLDSDTVWRSLTEVAPVELPTSVADERFDRVAEVMARVIDAKSPWTYKHSTRVKDIALGVAFELPGVEADPERFRALTRGALLHDIGKLGLSNGLLDKPGHLVTGEVESVQLHTVYSEHILSWIRPFQEALPFAAGHHERIDGRGYHSAVPAALLDQDVRVLAVADQFEALTSSRPHRDAFSAEDALGILAADAGLGVDEAALAALERFLSTPAASTILAPRRFDVEQLVIIG